MPSRAYLILPRNYTRLESLVSFGKSRDKYIQSKVHLTETKRIYLLQAII